MGPRWVPGPVWKGAENITATGIFSGFFLCFLSVLMCPECHAFCLFFLLYNTQYSQQTNIHVPGWFRTRNPYKRSASDPSRRPFGH